MKKNGCFKLFTIIFWSLFIVLSFPITKMDGWPNYVQTILLGCYMAVLVAAIYFSVKSKKSTKQVEKKLIDENIIAGRKIYKNILRKRLKLIMIFFAIFTLILMVPILIYLIIKHEKTYSIILACVMVVVYLTIVISYYFTEKIFFFPYKEIVFKGKSFVMFASENAFSRVKHQPVFHVVYNGTEYKENGSTMWVGMGNYSSALDVLDEVLVTSLLNWLEDNKYSKFIKIDVKSENGETFQCIYKIGRKQFFVTDNLDKLPNGFKKKSKSNKSKN